MDFQLLLFSEDYRLTHKAFSGWHMIKIQYDYPDFVEASTRKKISWNVKNLCYKPLHKIYQVIALLLGAEGAWDPMG